MAKFEDHISQAKRNLSFLESINQKVQDSFDWQVTVCFYTSLHLVNAHLSQYDLQYRKHKDVNFALNFENRTSPARLPEDEYLAYNALQSLSRRSRYLVNEKDNKLGTDQAFLIYEKHIARAFRHLDKLLIHFSARYSLDFKPVKITCSEIKKNELKFFL